MNLRKSSKAALMREIKRLRHYEKLAKERYEEIQRRDKATAEYKKITSFAVVFAKILNDAEDLTQQNKLWDHYWRIMYDKMKKGYITEFWAERCADLIDDFNSAIFCNESYILNYFEKSV